MAKTSPPLNPSWPAIWILLLVYQSQKVTMRVVGRFSNMAHFIPLVKLPSVKEIAEIMISHVFRIPGLPTDVVSDRGPQFASQ